MSRLTTWGDELTLRAAAEELCMTVHVLTSETENYYLKYEPVDDATAPSPKKMKHVFLAYISPVHYNSIHLKYD